MTKAKVRREAKRRKLHVADKKDSVGVCFIGDINVQEFLRKRIKERKGQVIDTNGNVIGEHKGVWFYTIGQRHGFKISNKLQVTSDKYKNRMPPLYVVSKDVAQNRLIVGTHKEALRDQFYVSDIHWINRKQRSKIKDQRVFVRIRHGGRLIPAQLEMTNDQFSIIKLKKPDRGIAPGQSAVFYLPAQAGRGEECLGGGIIQ